MKKNLRILALVLTCVLLLSTLTGCGSSSKYSDSTASYAAGAPAAYAVSEESAMAYDSYENGLSASGGAASASAESDAPEENPEKIIYSADATIETTDFDSTLAGLNEMVQSCGGYVQSSSVNNSNFYSISRGYRYNRSANYTIRIPSAQFTRVMNSLSTLGNVPYTYTYTENVTSQYYDVQARRNSLQTQEQSLLALMEKAESVEDIIAIEEKLTDVRYMIESLQSTLNNWDRRVQYSTIEISVNEVAEYTPEEPETFGSRLANAFRSGWANFKEFLEELVLFLAEALPTLILLGAIAFGIVKLVKKGSAKRRARKEARRAARYSAPVVDAEPVNAPEEKKE